MQSRGLKQGKSLFWLHSLSLECTSYFSRAHTPVCAGLCFVFLLEKVEYSGSIPVLTWFSAVIFCRQLSSDAGGPRLGFFHAGGPKIMAEVSSHVITPAPANCHPLWPVSLVPVAESHENASLPVNCPEFAWNSFISSESKIILDFPSPTATSLWHFLHPAWTENSAQKQILVEFWSLMVRDPGPTSSLMLLPTMLLPMHDLLYLLATLGNQRRAGKFSWLLPKGIWYHLEQGRRGHGGKGLPEVMLMVICSHKVQMKSMSHFSQLPGTRSFGKYRGSLQVFVLGLHWWKARSLLLYPVKAKHGKTPRVRFSLKYFLGHWLRGKGEEHPIRTVETQKESLWAAHSFCGLEPNTNLFVS